MINEDLFQEFIGNRKDLKKPMTPRAVKMLSNKLLRLEAEGYCPDKLIERSIINSWQDIYPHDSCKKHVQGFIEKHTDRSWLELVDTDNARRIK